MEAEEGCGEISQKINIRICTYSQVRDIHLLQTSSTRWIPESSIWEDSHSFWDMNKCYIKHYLKFTRMANSFHIHAPPLNFGAANGIRIEVEGWET